MTNKTHIVFYDHHGQDRIICRPLLDIPKTYEGVAIWVFETIFLSDSYDNFQNYIEIRNICLKCYRKYLTKHKI